jgi:hypothetical protein
MLLGHDDAEASPGLGHVVNGWGKAAAGLSYATGQLGDLLVGQERRPAHGSVE